MQNDFIYSSTSSFVHSCGFWPSRFTGKERDTESGLDYFGARYFGSNMGRFMSPDPGWFFASDPSNPQSWNAYAYAMNNPLSNIDPDGYDCVYLNDAVNGVESVDRNSSAGECGGSGGSWVDGTVTHVALYYNSNDVGLTGQTTSTDSQGNTTTTTTDAFYTNASSPAAQYLLPLWGYAPQTGTIDMAKLYKNRPQHFLSATPRAERFSQCAPGIAGHLALDLSPFGIVPDVLDAAMSGSTSPLFNSGDKLNSAGNAVEIAEKSTDALGKTLPFIRPAADILKPVGMGLSVVKAGSSLYNYVK